MNKQNNSRCYSAFYKGPAGSGWSLELIEKNDCGIGVNLNYHKVGWPNHRLFREEMNIHDLQRLKDFCETAILSMVRKK